MAKSKPKLKKPSDLAGVSTRRNIEPGSLIIVHFVEQQLEGWTFDPKHWPLHVTLVPWFQSGDEEAVMRSLERLARETSQLTLTVGPQARFGPRKNIPVNVIKNQSPVQALHKKMLATLESADIAFHESRYTGKEYTAHITRQKEGDRHSNEGERVLVVDFHVVRLLDGKQYEVDQQFMLNR